MSSNRNTPILQNIDYTQLFYWPSCMQTAKKGCTITSTCNANIFVHFWNFFQQHVYAVKTVPYIEVMYNAAVWSQLLFNFIFLFFIFFLWFAHVHILSSFLIILIISSNKSGWFLINVFIKHYKSEIQTKSLKEEWTVYFSFY